MYTYLETSDSAVIQLNLFTGLTQHSL